MPADPQATDRKRIGSATIVQRTAPATAAGHVGHLHLLHVHRPVRGQPGDGFRTDLDGRRAAGRRQQNGQCQPGQKRSPWRLREMRRRVCCTVVRCAVCSRRIDHTASLHYLLPRSRENRWFSFAVCLVQVQDDCNRPPAAQASRVVVHSTASQDRIGWPTTVVGIHSRPAHWPDVADRSHRGSPIMSETASEPGLVRASTRRSRRVSAIWLLPIVAIAIGAVACLGYAVQGRPDDHHHLRNR